MRRQRQMCIRPSPRPGGAVLRQRKTNTRLCSHIRPARPDRIFPDRFVRSYPCDQLVVKVPAVHETNLSHLKLMFDGYRIRVFTSPVTQRPESYNRREATRPTTASHRVWVAIRNHPGKPPRHQKQQGRKSPYSSFYAPAKSSQVSGNQKVRVRAFRFSLMRRKLKGTKRSEYEFFGSRYFSTA